MGGGVDEKHAADAEIFALRRVRKLRQPMRGSATYRRWPSIGALDRRQHARSMCRLETSAREPNVPSTWPSVLASVHDRIATFRGLYQCQIPPCTQHQLLVRELTVPCLSLFRS